jgi:sigma-54 specific flagellar transcriptional regulator A
LSVLHADQPVDILDLPSKYRAGFLSDDAMASLLADLAAAEPIDEEELIEEEVEGSLPDLPPGQAVASGVVDTPVAPVETSMPTLVDGNTVREAGTSGLLGGGVVPHLPAEGMDLRAYLNDIEHGLIVEALARSGGTVSQAARLLGLRRTTLVEKMRRFGLSGNETL